MVVCALTRYTLHIPCKTVTAEETLKILVSRVFCVFGMPAVIVSDNGSAFISHLNMATSRFYGYRHIHILPFNPQANSVAEAAVKRIKLLLDSALCLLVARFHLPRTLPHLPRLRRTPDRYTHPHPTDSRAPSAEPAFSCIADK